VIGIHALEVIRGKLPHRALHLVLDWAEFHQQELISDNIQQCFKSEHEINCAVAAGGKMDWNVAAVWPKGLREIGGDRE